MLITMMRPFQHEGLGMDMPQLFAVLRYDEATPVKDGVLQPERRDLLGDVEEIRYLDQKAWGANVALASPGLYQFIIEARPWWDAARDRFVQHYVKTTLPVYGVERGWELPVGQRFEIQPLTRPFGLTAPALFSGRALLNGQPLPNAPVRMARINTDKSRRALPPGMSSWKPVPTARGNSPLCSIRQGGGAAWPLPPAIPCGGRTVKPNPWNWLRCSGSMWTIRLRKPVNVELRRPVVINPRRAAIEPNLRHRQNSCQPGCEELFLPSGSDRRICRAHSPETACKQKSGAVQPEPAPLFCCQAFLAAGLCRVGSRGLADSYKHKRPT